MDGLITTITSLPVYFAFIPLGIIFIVLLVLIVKSSINVKPLADGVSGVSPVPAPAATSTPAVAAAVGAVVASTTLPPQPFTIPVTQQQAVPQTQVPAQVVVTPVVPPAQVSSLPQVEPSPLPLPVPAPIPPSVTPVVTGTVPPVSSWKPVPQVAASENMGVTESQMQAQAVAHEKIASVDPAPRVNVPIQPPAPTVIDVISEPVVTPATTPIVEVVTTPTPVPVQEPVASPVTVPVEIQAAPPAPLVSQEPVVAPAPATAPLVNASNEPEVITVPVTSVEEQATQVSQQSPLPTEAIKA